MSVDDYYKAMNVKHEPNCLICTFERRERKAHRSVLRRVWELEYTPYVLAVVLVVAVYMFATSKLIDYMVGGL